MDVNLRCKSPLAARQCVDFLVGKGVNSAVQYGRSIRASLTPDSVRRLGEDAADNGWAYLDDCDALTGAVR